MRGNWRKEDIEALRPLQVRALRKNAERARDEQVLCWCDEVLAAFGEPPGPRADLGQGEDLRGEKEKT